MYVNNLIITPVPIARNADTKLKSPTKNNPETGVRNKTTLRITGINDRKLNSNLSFLIVVKHIQTTTAIIPDKEPASKNIAKIAMNNATKTTTINELIILILLSGNFRMFLSLLSGSVSE